MSQSEQLQKALAALEGLEAMACLCDDVTGLVCDEAHRQAATVRAQLTATPSPVEAEPGDALDAVFGEYGTPDTERAAIRRALTQEAAPVVTEGERELAWIWDPSLVELKRCPVCATLALEGDTDCDKCGIEPADDSTWREVRALWCNRLRSTPAPVVGGLEALAGELVEVARTYTGPEGLQERHRSAVLQAAGVIRGKAGVEHLRAHLTPRAATSDVPVQPVGYVGEREIAELEGGRIAHVYPRPTGPMRALYADQPQGGTTGRAATEGEGTPREEMLVRWVRDNGTPAGWRQAGVFFTDADRRSPREGAEQADSGPSGEQGD